LKPRTYDYHESVLLAETVERLAPAVGKVIVDGTLGGGGHSRALLAAGAQVIGWIMIRRRWPLRGRGSRNLEISFGPCAAVLPGWGEALAGIGLKKVDGLLLDLGVSSRQLDAPERGFSFMREGPLDMRMDPESAISAADLVNTMSGEQLERIFRSLGEEPAARKIAAKLTRERLVRPLSRPCNSRRLWRASFRATAARIRRPGFSRRCGLP